MVGYESEKNMLKENFGLSDEEIGLVRENTFRVLEKFPELLKYEIEAEALSSVNCSAGIKKGDKFVFSAMPIMLKAEKSTAPLCMRALGVVTPFLNNIADRIIDGLNPNGSVWQVAECMDPGLGNNGLGKTIF